MDVFDLEFWRERLVEDRLGLKEESLGGAAGAVGAVGAVGWMAWEIWWVWRLRLVE